MRIVLATEYFYPQSKGGTEMYVHQLAKELIHNGHDCLIVSLSNDKLTDSYDDIEIKYIPYLNGEYNESANPSNLHFLISILDTFNPDVFHLHTLSPSLGATHLLHLKRIGYNTIITTHLPNFTCSRGDLLRNGKEVCDGVVEYNKCMKCVLQKKGVKNSSVRNILVNVSKFKSIRNLFPGLSDIFHKQEQISIFKGMNKIITVSNWQKEVLLKNDFEESKISIVRQSVFSDFITHTKINPIGAKIKFGYIGRIVPEKGFHLISEAIKELPTNTFELYVAALKSENHIDYYNKQKLITEKSAVHWHENINAEEIKSFLDGIDVLLVPSTWLETGPYVIFESLARKVPVIAFNKGGSVELIENGRNSILVNTESEFKLAIEKCIKQPNGLNALIANINLDRTTERMYSEMEKIYTEIIKH